MNKIITHFFIIVSFTFVFFLFFSFQSKQTITYFPIDKTDFFEEIETNLSVNEEDISIANLKWDTYSKTNKSLYLRQDVSLLYQNGKLIGAKNKWKNNVSAIKMKHAGINTSDGLWEAISYHHGEIHHADQSINSIHSITKDSLYIIHNTSDEINYFKEPETASEKKSKAIYDDNRLSTLNEHWHNLLKHFNITLENYNSFPLTEVDKFTQEPLPNLNQEETNKILGQLWEGIYKNYIMTIVQSKPTLKNSFIPIVLVDKKKKHLIVLYELNAKKEMLIQKISN